MRWLLAAAFVAASVAATWAGLPHRERLDIDLAVSYAVPDSLGGNVAEHRVWRGEGRVVVHSANRCAEVDLAIVRRRIRSGRIVGVSPWLTTVEGEQPLAFDYSGYRGDRIELETRARCAVGAAAGLRGTATRRLVIPAADCRRGPLRVLSVKGEARVTQGRLRPGDRLEGASPVDVLRGRLTIGAPECNGFRAVLLPGRIDIGDYDPNARGAFFRGRRVILVRADDHAGGYQPLDLPVRVVPEGIRCAECSVPLPASFAARSGNSRMAVRVYAGTVLVGNFGGRYIRVRAGEQLFAHCGRQRAKCQLSEPTLFQPREPFTLVKRRPRPLARTIPGRRRPPIGQLAPARSEAQVTPIRSAGGEPALLVVGWSRERRTAARRGLTQHKGLLLWQRRGGGWQRAYARRYSGWLQIGWKLADVTRDGQSDLLLTEWEGGTGYCGLRRVLASVNGTIRDLFRRHMCETDIEARHGDLLVPTPVGPCPSKPGSAHCFGGRRYELLRWNGARLSVHRTWITCHRPQLDPRRGCRRRR